MAAPRVTRPHVTLPYAGCSPGESAHLRGVAEEAAARSTAYLLDAFRTPMAIEHKGGPHDLVTEHDLASEAILRDALTTSVPDSRVVGEEGGGDGQGRVTWFVDPIDGTVNFSHGLAYWCVSIAAVIDGEVVAGVIAAPALGQVFAVDHDGVTVNGAPATPRRVENEIDAFVISTFPRGVDLESNGDAALAATRRLTRAFGSHRALGSGALGLAHVACGWADATFDIHTNAWDVAAGSLMVRTGGGRFVGVLGGVPDESPTTAYLHPAYWATGADVDYPTLREVVTEMSRDGTVG
ncbi:MAG TPA: inositol monophosphatase [Phycicoccus sp.]|nr:inositol monophosphatase [Phycicoccus sp.]